MTTEAIACYCCGTKHLPFHPELDARANYTAMYEGHSEEGCRAIVICRFCLEKGGFDMWTEQAEWNSKNPLVPYHLLPRYDHDDPERDDPTKYPLPQELLILEQAGKPTMNASKITIIDDLHPEDNAMLQALQSRSPASVDERLKKVHDAGSGQFMDKFYVGYGHKSIGDCGNTTIYIEGVTMLMAKAIQDWPLYSGQEASTRYMDFSEAEFHNPLVDGWSADQWHAGQHIQKSWREFYLAAQEPVRKHLREKYPRQDGEDKGMWERAINARSFDILRGFLPAGASTNLSWSTNLRQAQDHLMWLLHHPDRAVQDLAIGLSKALREKYPHSFSFKESKEASDYYQEVMRDHYFFTDFTYKPSTNTSGFGGIREDDIHRDVAKMLRTRPKGQEIPWFVAEYGNITSCFMLDFGSFRDLQRHRNGTVRMPLLTTEHGFHPWYLDELPPDVAEDARAFCRIQESNIRALKCDEVTKQNYIAMGYQVPCRVTQSLPAFVYRLELRSGKTIHPTLRQVIHEEIRQFKQRFPSIALHVDMDPDSWTVRRGKQTITEKNEEG